ncbi:hypothetical protein IEQ34_013155 [Dendrobium chrysotoxum]|uniref:Uncharacterized protein n=1 Tax=Dendrobium chrysotoxum TaxID=161865 RepID=A0AAV7GNQ2_DENCH|nr:hypothetical protein IEQ34_013155 [Dendrobium chrysotoxum]
MAIDSLKALSHANQRIRRGKLYLTRTAAKEQKSPPTPCTDDKLHKVGNNCRVLSLLLPSLKQLNQEQDAEKKKRIILSKFCLSFIGLKLCELRIEKSTCETSIFDLHESFLSCEFELCITCCKEIRENNLSCTEDVLSLANRGYEYTYGGNPKQSYVAKHENQDNLMRYLNEVDHNGEIYYPPKEVGGCGKAVLKLKSMLPEGWSSKLEANSDY